jgi:hypothetical protein
MAGIGTEAGRLTAPSQTAYYIMGLRQQNAGPKS